MTELKPICATTAVSQHHTRLCGTVDAHEGAQLRDIIGIDLLQAYNKHAGAFTKLIYGDSIESVEAFEKCFGVDYEALVLLLRACFVLAPDGKSSAKTQLMLLLDGGHRIISEDDLWQYTGLMMDRRKLAGGKAEACNSRYDLCVLELLKKTRTVHGIIKTRNYRTTKSSFYIDPEHHMVPWGLHEEGYAPQKTDLRISESHELATLRRTLPWFDDFVAILVDTHVADVANLWLAVYLPVTSRLGYNFLKEAIGVNWIRRTGLAQATDVHYRVVEPSWVAALDVTEPALPRRIVKNSAMSGTDRMDTEALVAVIMRTNITVMLMLDAPERLCTPIDRSLRHTSNAAFIDASNAHTEHHLELLEGSAQYIHQLAVNRLNQYLHMPEEEARAMAQDCVKTFMRKYGVAPLTQDGLVVPPPATST
jgi:hypothetical protein